MQAHLASHELKAIAKATDEASQDCPVATTEVLQVFWD